MSARVVVEPPKVRWDLSALFSGLDDPKLLRAWEDLHQRADSFATKFRGKINDPQLTASTLAAALQEIETIYRDASKPYNFAELLFSCDAASPEVGAFLAQQRESWTDLSVKILFFELELQSLDEAVLVRLIEDPLLANYRHYISVARVYAPHRLSEAEEIILEETANTGCRAWVRLYEELLGNHVFHYTDPSGETHEKTEQEVIALLRDPSREVRTSAGDSLTSGLKEIERVTLYIYNTIVQDKRVGDKLRDHPYPEHSRHLSNELQKDTVDMVVKLCVENYDQVARYYRVKRDVLGLPELTHIDRYAPLFEAKEQVEWERAKQIVLDSFAGFSGTLMDRAAEFFDNNWIDAEPRKGKTGGAFCNYLSHDLHPVVFMSYLNKMDDVMTLAHELGHGVHASLSRKQTEFNYHGTLPLAELASIFGEMLVFEKLTSTASDRDKLAMYAQKLEGIFASVFRQAAMFQFEQDCHEFRRNSGELSDDDIHQLWQKQLQAMFGDSVHLGDDHRYWWSMVGHFFFAPFYVYAYSFGELLTMSLYQKAKSGGQEFADKYVSLLELGGSKSPQELMEVVGVDLNSEEFWRGGFVVLEGLIAEFERLWTVVGRG